MAVVGIASPASASVKGPGFKVTVSLDRDTYAVGDAVTLTVTVTSLAAYEVTGVKVHGFNNGVSFGAPEPDDEPAIDFAPGASKTVVRHGVVEPGAGDRGRVEVLRFYHADDQTTANVGLGSDRARVPGAKGNLTGTAYKTADGTIWAGDAGLPRLKIELLDDISGEVTAATTTDNKGKYGFINAPVGSYNLRYTPPSGWKIPVGAQVLIRASSPFSQDIAAVKVPGEPDGSTIDDSGTTTGGTTATGTTTTTGTTTSSGTGSQAQPVATAPTSMLAVTGSNAGLISFGGAVLLAIGGAAYMVGRRRRLRFTVGD